MISWFWFYDSVIAWTKFEAIFPKDVGGVAFSAEADALHQILGSPCKTFLPVVSMALVLKGPVKLL